MITRAEIQRFVDDVIARFSPRQVFLFGSYAYGKPTRDSDVDLMVVIPHNDPAPQLAARIMLACEHHFPLDLIVRSPKELRRRLVMGDSFLSEVTSKGILLHEAVDARVD